LELNSRFAKISSVRERVKKMVTTPTYQERVNKLKKAEASGLHQDRFDKKNKKGGGKNRE